MNKRPNIGEIWDQLTVVERELLVRVINRFPGYKNITMGSLAFISVGVFFDQLSPYSPAGVFFKFGTSGHIRGMLSKAVNAQRRLEANEKPKTAKSKAG